MSAIIEDVIALQQKHKNTWRANTEAYWLARLMQEVGELASSLADDHDDPPEWELKQIAAICINWLEMRSDRETYGAINEGIQR